MKSLAAIPSPVVENDSQGWNLQRGSCGSVGVNPGVEDEINPRFDPAAMTGRPAETTMTA
jgi:hypothetical protein